MCLPHNYCTFTANTKLFISWALCIHILLHSVKTQVSLSLVLYQSGYSKFCNSYSVKFTINTTTVKPLQYCTFCSFHSRGLWSWVAVQLIVAVQQFHHLALVREWVEHHPRFRMVFLPPYSPFLNLAKEFFSSWKWKVYDSILKRIRYDNQKKSSSSNGRGLWKCCGRSLSSVDSPPTMHDLWQYMLRCTWNSLARCKVS